MEVKGKILERRLVGIMETREVWLDNTQLTPERSQKFHNHSPDGFNWGYGGSGPAQLALAICLELHGEENVTPEIYQDFKWKLISKLPQGDFDILFYKNSDATLFQTSTVLKIDKDK